MSDHYSSLTADFLSQRELNQKKVLSLFDGIFAKYPDAPARQAALDSLAFLVGSLAWKRRTINIPEMMIAIAVEMQLGARFTSKLLCQS
jgi:hypothetical protein